MKPLISLLVLRALSATCSPAQIIAPTATATPAARFTPTATLTPIPSPTSTPRGFVGRVSDNEFAVRDLDISWIDMVDTRHGWALALVPGVRYMLATTADGGATWTDKTLARYVGPWRFSVLDADTALWLGEPGLMPAGEAGLLRTVDGGLTWTLSPAPWSPDAEIKLSTPTDGIAITRDAPILETHDAGASWQEVPISGPGQVHETICSGCNPSIITIYDYCWSCGDTLMLRPSGEVIITHATSSAWAGDAIRLSLSPDLGKTWQNIAVLRPPDVTGARSALADAPIFFDTLRGLMWVVFSLADSSRVAVVYSTADGGRSWTAGSAPQDGMPGPSYYHAIVSATDVFATCGENLCVTHDAGHTWTTIEANTHIDYQGSMTGHDYPVLSQLDFIDPLTGWAIEAGWPDFYHHLYRTTDGGYT